MNSSPTLSSQSVSSVKYRPCQSYWKKIRLNKRLLKNTVIAELAPSFSSDPRPHATIQINGIHILGLLDSGASVSCLGKNASNRIEQLGLKLQPLCQSIHTADGSPQSVVGLVEVDAYYRNKGHKLSLYVVPSLSQELYLGIDFWTLFGLAHVMVEELDKPLNTSQSPSPNPACHQLSPSQEADLNLVKSNLLSSEVLGLGKTTVLQHTIDTGTSLPVKQRHHFVSPAILSILHEEVDDMLNRGIIEESHSSWSSPVVVVKKPNGKKKFCLDCRAVNKLTVKDAYPMPIIDGILANLHETVIYPVWILKMRFGKSN